MSDEKIRILVVDDDPFVRTMVKNILEAGGYTVKTSGDGGEALRRCIPEHDADLVIPGMNMSGMDGLSFIRELRQADPDIPVIILTVNTEVNVAVKAIREGATGYLLNDENIENTLLVAVEKVMEMYHLKRQNARLTDALNRHEQEELMRRKAAEPPSVPLDAVYPGKAVARKTKRIILPDTLKILVADDDAFVRDLLAFMLESDGYQVETAEDGVDALKKYLENPDKNLIVSDMDMPNMNGMELISELRKAGTDVPLIILTANSQISVALEAINRGASDYLLKDENIQDTILIAVKKVIEKYFLEKRIDSLLKNTLPEMVADEMKYRGRFAPRRYHCTILFSDFVRFTQLAEAVSDEELIRLLDELFMGFDDLISHFRGTKIKTIGDAYMAVFGAPGQYEDHALMSVRAAIALLDFVQAFNRENSRKFRMRIGIHTGTVMAGVVGRERMQFDVFGDDVNIASRFESSGSPGRINISEKTWFMVRDHFEFEERGLIPLKNKSDMKAYFVLGER